MTKFQDLNLSNAFLFAATAQDPEACRVILQSILEKEISQVNVHTEHTVFFSSDYRMIRLDVYGQDELDVQYNIEMQNQNKGNLSKRARFHHAQMDVTSLKPGMDFARLNPSYVIFICTFDPFGKGLYRYTFMQRCVETDISIGDEACTIFFNTKGKNAEHVSEELREFLAYFENSTDEFVKESKAPGVKLLHEKVKQVKQDAKLEEKYMTVEEWMRMREEDAVEQGLERGMAQGLERGMAQGMAQGMSKTILGVLSAKFEVPEKVREAILCQNEISVLDEWVAIAANATSVEDFISKSAI